MIAAVDASVLVAALRMSERHHADDAAIRVTIPRGEMDLSQVEAILRPFRFTSLVAGSQMSKAEAMRIAEDFKAAWWEKNERRFAPPEA